MLSSIKGGQHNGLAKALDTIIGPTSGPGPQGPQGNPGTTDVPIVDATLSTRGIVQLTNTVSTNETMAITPRGIDDLRLSLEGQISEQVKPVFHRATFTEDGTFIVPQGINKIYVTACAGGGGGGTGTIGESFQGRRGGGGGAGGGYVYRQPYDVFPGQTISVTLGKGGIGSGNSTTGSGNNGIATTIGGLVTLPGGNGGSAAGATGYSGLIHGIAGPGGQGTASFEATGAPYGMPMGFSILQQGITGYYTQAVYSQAGGRGGSSLGGGGAGGGYAAGAALVGSLMATGPGISVFGDGGTAGMLRYAINSATASAVTFPPTSGMGINRIYGGPGSGRSGGRQLSATSAVPYAGGGGGPGAGGGGGGAGDLPANNAITGEGGCGGDGVAFFEWDIAPSDFMAHEEIEFTSTLDSFTVPTGVTRIYVTGCGPGGPGGDSQHIAANVSAAVLAGGGGAGGGGAFCIKRPVAVTPGATYKIQLGNWPITDPANQLIWYTPSENYVGQTIIQLASAVSASNPAPIIQLSRGGGGAYYPGMANPAISANSATMQAGGAGMGAGVGGGVNTALGIVTPIAVAGAGGQGNRSGAIPSSPGNINGVGSMYHLKAWASQGSGGTCGTNMSGGGGGGGASLGDGADGGNGRPSSNPGLGSPGQDAIGYGGGGGGAGGPVKAAGDPNAIPPAPGGKGGPAYLKIEWYKDFR